MSDPSRNSFLEGKLSALFVRTALPIVFVMSMNGLVAVTDALFLGHYVGPDALAAVTLMFPFYMLIVALATLVGGGMSSLLARHLGGQRLHEARRLFASAHWLAMAAAALLILLYAAFGSSLILLAADGNDVLAALAAPYLRIIVLFSPVLFVLSVNSDALRNEGRAGLMAATSLVVSISNVGFNYLLIAVLQLGVTGSACGTVLAQMLALGAIVIYRSRSNTPLRLTAVMQHVTTAGWSRILALGAPQSLGFVGVALGSTAILAALQIAGSQDYPVTVTAYGVVTRALTFAILPLLGLSQAMQAITGNNYGAGLWQRGNASLLVAAGSALVFCAIAQWCLSVYAAPIGRAFVDDPRVAARVGEIMPVSVALFIVTGPLMMVAAHFQAIGDAARAAVLGLSKTYLFAIPLTFALPLCFDANAVWWAAPAAEASLLGLTVYVLVFTARRQTLRWGVFKVEGKA